MSQQTTSNADKATSTGVKKFEILEHRADIKIKVFGKTLVELYENAVWAMASILFKNANPKKQELRLAKTIIIKSIDREVLLIDFLNDILGESQINQAIYPIVRLIDFQPDGVQGMVYLKAKISGYEIERFDEDIKAVTYHDLNISQDKNGIWEATILFDV
ncbi:MAG: archease [bacterium]|nr:archease [bacterium]